MPPPRKVDLLPDELRAWLKDALQERGFAGYEDLADDLNAMLEGRGLELRIGKSALHSFGQEHREFVKYQEEASRWAADWMQGNGLEEEAKRHNVLFQMITTLAFKVMMGMQNKSADEIDPKELHFLGRMLKDVMASSGIREKLVEEERKRIAEEARAAAMAEVTDRLDEAEAEGGSMADAARKAREIMGFE
ncbi:phage protein Gp27 family protein [Maritimibacter sp. HL-12]|uniref:phage protein Gp27 family protein n=1 Tax=Maritimibacter sp. HL-12 TaxID=1162418 RepID=UPI000A0F19A3|nr:phage protein Gp27 family protein [Maritimibacter sp. HL-12]SMH35948.1 Protein of unknown function [Maritimibacter sp. HL-12]